MRGKYFLVGLALILIGIILMQGCAPSVPIEEKVNRTTAIEIMTQNDCWFIGQLDDPGAGVSLELVNDSWMIQKEVCAGYCNVDAQTSKFEMSDNSYCMGVIPAVDRAAAIEIMKQNDCWFIGQLDDPGAGVSLGLVNDSWEIMKNVCGGYCRVNQLTSAFEMSDNSYCMGVIPAE